MKLVYQSPEMDVICLAAIQETMQSASTNAVGADVDFLGSSDFNTFFGL